MFPSPPELYFLDFSTANYFNPGTTIVVVAIVFFGKPFGPYMTADEPGDIGSINTPCFDEALCGPPVINQKPNITAKIRAKKPISFQISSDM